MTLAPTLDTSRLGRVHADTLFVADHWPDLHEARIPGTRRPWTQTRTRSESRQRPAQDWAGAIVGMTAAPAPVNIDVLDALVDILAISHALADAVAQLAGTDRLPAPDSAYADPRPHLELVTKHFNDAAAVDGGWIVNSALDPDDDMSIVRARHLTATSLRLILAGQALDADCPWCSARPMRIRIVKDEPLVVCESRRVCQPPETDCGNWVRGRPAWIMPEWEWLAKRIHHANEGVAWSVG